MGTTATILLFCDKSLHIAQVGDSRCYLLRSHGFWQITRDHSMVEEKVRMGLITRAKAKTDEMKNVITRSVGFESTVDADLYHVEIQSGDLFMICSDGLSGLVDDLVLFQMIEDATARGESPQIIAEALIEEANSKGGDDNITSVVVQVK
jgi:protein phosphatase